MVTDLIVESVYAVASVHCGPVSSPGKLGGLWQEGIWCKNLGWDIGFSHPHLCDCSKKASDHTFER